MSSETLVANPWDQSITDCAHCGQMSKTIWGDISEGSTVKAIYYVTWTVDDAAHDVNVDLVIGPWDGAPPESRKLAALLYRPAALNGSFMVIDAVGRPADKRTVCGSAMMRNEVIGTDLASFVFDLVDSVWLTDPRIESVRKLDQLV